MLTCLLSWLELNKVYVVVVVDNPVQTLANGSRKFQLEFGLRQFKPEEIHVRISGSTLTVSAKRVDPDIISSKGGPVEYNRSYMLPKDITPNSLMSELRSDGLLVIRASLPALEGQREKIITTSA
ncbi:protein lethal(2)essential for life-like [Ruditapes philippinarum]|uniref:protein lethal(2)essential for life-like n=1 Tax=Ruditapes philippinarum TaxID=129788 RepID=UPI00295C281E|nr:protein lethal(2)essential for life-like [Ruditapes philippinarum]